MARFKYSALKNNNTIIDGEIEAGSLREAREKVRSLGFIPTKVYSEEFIEEPVKVQKRNGTRITFLSLQQKIAFTQELQTLLSSGIPIIEALHAIEVNAPDLKIQTLCMELQTLIQSGMTFAQSIQSVYGNVFGNVYTALVKAGEDAGELEVTLDRMILLLRKEESIKGKILTASIYPMVLILLMLGVLTIFATFVFPRFASFIYMNGGSMPPLASFIMGSFDFIGKFWWLIFIGIGALVGFVSSMFKNPKIKSKWDNFILTVPIISNFVEYINLSNFMSVLHISYEAGLPIMSCLELGNKSVGNYNIKSRIYNAVNIVRSGKTLTEAFQRTRAIPNTLMSIVSAGEKSGTLGKMLRDAAEVIDAKVDLALEAMTRLFEPTVIVIMGIAVAIMLFAFMQAYAGMLGSI